MITKKNNCFSCTQTCQAKNNFNYKSSEGLTREIIQSISSKKNEPTWMLDFRLKAFEEFQKKELPTWGPNLDNLNLKDLNFYLESTEKQEHCWDNIPQKIKNAADMQIIKKTEKNFGGLGFQYESEVIYHNLKKELKEKGIIFTDTDSALKNHPEIFKKYFSTVVPANDNKFAALNSATWSGGSFIYVPKNVTIEIPLQAYYKIASEKLGQFERTLIIADENSSVSYMEGCTAQNSSSNSLHSAVVEIIALKGARVKYYTIQNWSKNVFNLVTKRAIAYDNAIVEWIDCSIGSGISMKYPAVILAGDNAKTEILSLSIADKNQIQDTGAKAIHLASNTSSKIYAKSISHNGGRTSFRGFVKVVNNAKNSKSYIECDSLILDQFSRADSYPYLKISEKTSDIGHEARISKISDEKIFYLTSRGINPQNAQALIINGFVEPIAKGLPPEYEIEINRFLENQIKEKSNEK